MNKIDSLKRNIIDLVEQINDEQELKNYLDFSDGQHNVVLTQNKGTKYMIRKTDLHRFVIR